MAKQKLTKEQAKLRKELWELCQQLEDKFRQGRDMGCLIKIDQKGPSSYGSLHNCVLYENFTEFTVTFEYMALYEKFGKKHIF